MVTQSSQEKFRIPLLVGLLLLLVVVLADISGLSDALIWSRLPRIILSLAGMVLLGWGTYLWRTSERTFDERFLMHRLKASRAALVAGMAAILVWLMVDLLASPAIIRWQLLGILAAMALTKVGAMIYYRRSD
jgi:hypothetical protein